ncbi:endonuclease/exonuclease/phosphatase family protein [Streptomyces sp. NPDC020799]|uniref:endonuclease/exonuclease/phosphatase family protein n=1 Tax=Streptomyces sp. NPDC020799 TaxID=3365091 RepID=UPI00378DD5A4
MNTDRNHDPAPLPRRPRLLAADHPTTGDSDRPTRTGLAGPRLTGTSFPEPRLVPASAAAVPPLASAPARLVTYNTLAGGIDADGGERRRLEQTEFLASLDADVIALQDLRGWGQGGWWRLWAVAHALGMVPLPPVLCARGGGRHQALLYRPRTVRVVSYVDDAEGGTFHHGLGRARLYVKDQPLTVLFTHLCPLGGAERLAEAQWLTAYGDTWQGDPQRVVLAGDLNTIGQHDPEPDWFRVPASRRSRHCHLTPGGAFGDTDRRAIQLLAKAGFHDPFDVLGQAPPCTTGYWGPEEAVEHRSDFILANWNVVDHVTAADVHDTETTRALSDHLPVVLDIAPPAL